MLNVVDGCLPLSLSLLFLIPPGALGPAALGMGILGVLGCWLGRAPDDAEVNARLARSGSSSDLPLLRSDRWGIPGTGEGECVRRRWSTAVEAAEEVLLLGVP